MPDITSSHLLRKPEYGGLKKSLPLTVGLLSYGGYEPLVDM